MRLDSRCERWTADNDGALVSWVMMAAYAYYILDTPLISDRCYDGLCRRLRDHWRSIRHPHKWLIDRDRRGVSVLLTEDDYPEIVKGATWRLLKELKDDRRKKARARRRATARR